MHLNHIYVSIPKSSKKHGTLHNQLIPLKHITLGTLDIWINLVDNALHSQLHHLLLHLKEDLLLGDDDAGYVASRSRSAPFEKDLFGDDVAVPDVCTCLPVIPRWQGVGHVPVGEVDEGEGGGRGRGGEDEVSVWVLNHPQVSACPGSL